MQLEIDFRSDQPIYLQIVEQIQQLILQGDLQTGDQLPTVRQLATDLRVNFNTIARAYRLLDEAGLISTQQGRGTYIWERPSDEKVGKMRQQNLEELVQKYTQELERLGYSAEELIAVFSSQIEHWREQQDEA